MEYSESALQKVREDRLLIDRVDRWLYDEMASYLGQRVLEIGCGMGNFARWLTDRELYIATDISAESVTHLAQTYADRSNMHCQQVDVTADKFLELEHLEVDTVFSLNVFEHIEDDMLAIRNVHRILQPSGYFVLVIPAHPWLYGSIDKAIGHYRRYSKQEVKEAFEQSGFRCVEQKHINALGAIGWLVNGRVLKQETPPSDQLRLFNSLVPLLQRVEQAVSVPFGISLMTIGQKL